MYPYFESVEVSRLVIQAQQGDEHAAERLVQLYRPLVHQVARRFYLPNGEPEDIYQVGMIGLWQAIQRYNPERRTSFATFARICIRRHILSALKQATRAVWITFPPCPDPETEYRWENIADPTPSALEQLMEQERTEDIQQILSHQLSSLEAQVLALRSQGVPYRQIAHRIGCSFKAVDNALTRIKRKVRRATRVK